MKSLTRLALIGLLSACTSGGGGQNDESTEPLASTPASSDAASSGVASGGEASPECAEAFAPLAEMELTSTSDLGDLPEVDATIEKAMAIDDQPVVVDFRVHRDAMVWPMVAAGTSNDEIKSAGDLAPEFDRVEDDWEVRPA